MYILNILQNITKFLTDCKTSLPRRLFTAILRFNTIWTIVMFVQSKMSKNISEISFVKNWRNEHKDNVSMSMGVKAFRFTYCDTSRGFSKEWYYMCSVSMNQITTSMCHHVLLSYEGKNIYVA